MSNAGLTCRAARPEDDPRLLELFHTSFGRHFPADWWNWFSYTCPTGHTRTALIEDTSCGRLAASYTLLPIRLKLNDRVVEASLATNASTHPDYRGRDLFTEIGRTVLDQDGRLGRGVSLGMPNLNARPGHRKVGWKVLCPLPFLFKKDLQPGTHRCREVDAFDVRFDAFFARAAAPYSLIVMKDHRFANWRFVERPDQVYTRLVIDQGDSIAGYVVLKTFDDGTYRKAHILDLHAADDSALDELLRAAESYAAGRDELNLWTNPHDPYRERLLARGYHQRDGQDILILRFNERAEEPVDETAWNFCLADNDVY